MSEIILAEDQTEIIEQKRKSWGQMGIVIHKQEFALQAEAQESLNKISHPTTIDDVPAAELVLKEVKKAQTTIEEKRKAITGKFDAVVQRLMAPEKSFAQPIKLLSDAIISVKKDHEAKERLKQAKADELKKIRESLLNNLINIEFEYKNKINNLVSSAYNYALGDGQIDLVSLEEYLVKVRAKLSINDFTPIRPNPASAYNSKDEVAAVISEVYKIDSEAYLQMFYSELNQRFMDYNIAFANKKEALLIAKQEEEKALTVIQEEKTNKTVAVQLDFTSQDISIAPSGIKALKQSYEVDMPETVESVLKIMAAFTANLNICLPKLKVNKWFAFTPGQAANVLGKIKSDDNNFSPSGITFKIVDKL